jgi:hypothetical protein
MSIQAWEANSSMFYTMLLHPLLLPVELMARIKRLDLFAVLSNSIPARYGTVLLKENNRQRPEK